MDLNNTVDGTTASLTTTDLRTSESSNQTETSDGEFIVKNTSSYLVPSTVGTTLLIPNTGNSTETIIISISVTIAVLSLAFIVICAIVCRHVIKSKKQQQPDSETTGGQSNPSFTESGHVYSVISENNMIEHQGQEQDSYPKYREDSIQVTQSLNQYPVNRYQQKLDAKGLLKVPHDGIKNISRNEELNYEAKGLKWDTSQDYNQNKMQPSVTRSVQVQSPIAGGNITMNELQLNKVFKDRKQQVDEACQTVRVKGENVMTDNVKTPASYNYNNYHDNYNVGVANNASQSSDEIYDDTDIQPPSSMHQFQYHSVSSDLRGHHSSNKNPPVRVLKANEIFSPELHGGNNTPISPTDKVTSPIMEEDAAMNELQMNKVFRDRKQQVDNTCQTLPMKGEYGLNCINSFNSSDSDSCNYDDNIVDIAKDKTNKTKRKVQSNNSKNELELNKVFQGRKQQVDEACKTLTKGVHGVMDDTNDALNSDSDSSNYDDNVVDIANDKTNKTKRKVQSSNSKNELELNKVFQGRKQQVDEACPTNDILNSDSDSSNYYDNVAEFVNPSEHIDDDVYDDIDTQTQDNRNIAHVNKKEIKAGSRDYENVPPIPRTVVKSFNHAPITRRLVKNKEQRYRELKERESWRISRSSLYTESGIDDNVPPQIDHWPKDQLVTPDMMRKVVAVRERDKPFNYLQPV